MSTNGDLQQKLKAGVDAAKRGDRITARRLLEQVVQADENNELAWMWLASAVNTVAERRSCLERVLQINPRNERAAEALRRLDSSGSSAAAEEEARARQTINQFRQAQPTRSAQAYTPPPSPTADGAGGLPINTSSLILIGVVVAVIVGAAAIASAVGTLNSQPTATPTEVAQLAPPTSAFTPTPIPTNTGVAIGQITRNAPTLPPTLTPSRTPTPTETAEPTEEPTPLAQFSLIYASLNPGADQPDMYRIQADGSEESFMADFARDLAFARDGQNIAFVRDFAVDGGEEGAVISEIYVTTINDPASATPLTNFNLADTSSPSWSPDGSQIVFSSSHESDNPELWVMDANGQNLRRLTENGFADREPSWSPDGTRIVYSADADLSGAPEIFMLTLPGEDGGESVITRLTDAGGASYSPTWAFDGSMIAFASDRDGFGDIYTMDAQGEGETVVTSGDGDVENRRPAISPDNRWIAFISNRDGDFQTYVISLINGEVVRVTDNPRADFSVVFRPLGR